MAGIAALIMLVSAGFLLFYAGAVALMLALLPFRAVWLICEALNYRLEGQESSPASTGMTYVILVSILLLALSMTHLPYFDQAYVQLHHTDAAFFLIPFAYYAISVALTSAWLILTFIAWIVCSVFGAVTGTWDAMIQAIRGDSNPY
jgi:hypothetical protein